MQTGDASTTHFPLVQETSAQSPITEPSPVNRAAWRTFYNSVRAQTETLAAPLSAEDQSIQSMPDASPTKWHRAHTTWFFETLVLASFKSDYMPFDPAYAYLFNSYYEGLGPRLARAERGLMSRPTCDDVARYRDYVDEHMHVFFATASEEVWRAAAPVIALGCHHEQQHQELLLMDILHAFSRNPTSPAYKEAARPIPAQSSALRWICFPGGDAEIGYDAAGFAYDNEGPRHTVKVAPFALASRLVTNGEWLSFMADGGYSRPELWLSDGWATVQQQRWKAPLYWCETANGWQAFTLNGCVELNRDAPVCHVSFYEADAYARWAGKRLPTEFEWEVAAGTQPLSGNFLERGTLRPEPAPSHDGLGQMFGDAWGWTQSAYAPYPGFKPAPGAVAEYNGKFMINQVVLRGGCCVTPARHMRRTYRNFFYPHMRWQFASVRLAEDV